MHYYLYFRLEQLTFHFSLFHEKNYYSMYFIVKFNLYQQNYFDQVFYKILMNIN